MAKDEIEVELEDDDIEVKLDDEGKEPEKKEEKKAAPRVKLVEPEDDDEEDQLDPVAEATKALEEAKAGREKAEAEAKAAQAQASAERQRREAAERTASQRAREADAARAEADTAQLTLIDKGIDGAKGEVEAYTGQLSAAYEAGEFKTAAEIQAKLSQATAKLDRLEATKEQVVAQGKRASADTTEGRVEAVSDTAENYLSGFAPEAQTWLRQHPECLPPKYGGTTAANAKMMAGHYAALGQNITPNTVDYFKVIEEHTGHRAPVSAAAEVKKADEGEAKPAARQPRAAPSAPPSREPPAANGRQSRASGGSVRLSKEQQDTAKMSFPHLSEKEAFAQYARNLVELEAEGKIGRTTH